MHDITEYTPSTLAPLVSGPPYVSPVAVWVLGGTALLTAGQRGVLAPAQRARVPVFTCANKAPVFVEPTADLLRRSLSWDVGFLLSEEGAGGVRAGVCPVVLAEANLTSCRGLGFPTEGIVVY